MFPGGNARGVRGPGHRVGGRGGPGHRGGGGRGRGNHHYDRVGDGGSGGRGHHRTQQDNQYQAWGVAGGGDQTTDGERVPNNFETQDDHQPRRKKPVQEYERRGPVFGFKRMHGFLNTDPNDVVLSIYRDIGSWKEFLASEDLKPKTDLMALVIQVLGNKICSDDVTLKQQQVDILLRTFVQEFMTKIFEQCSAICMGTSVLPRRRYTADNLMEVDSTPITFLSSIFQYCNFVCKKMPETALDYLSQIVAPAFGAISSISEDSNDGSSTNLRERFVGLKSELSSLMKKREAKPAARCHRFDEMSEEFVQELHNMDAPNDYKEIPIIPSAKELLSREETFLRPNIVRGSYKSAQHYLDTQFRLLREDFVRPLKNGIQNFMQFKVDYLARKKKLPMGEIRIYPDVQIVNAELVRDECVYTVQLPEQTYKRIKWDKSKRLLTGSLLVFTQPPDFFQETFFAVVASRKVEELSKGLLSLTWEGRQPTWDKDEEYLMVECEVYFESYRHTLQTLKDLELETFPMCKFIVEGSTDVRPPQYLEAVRGMVQMKIMDGSTVTFSPLMREHWPSHEQLGLDPNQYEAFKASLTTQFAIIQGPPGTGKTYLGLRIAETLLSNESAWKTQSDGPIFVVCYTNHALDQFMEGILQILEDQTEEGNKFDPSCMIRVGGRSKSEVMQKFSLINILKNRTLMQKMPKNYWPLRNEAMDNITDWRNARSSMMTAVMGLRDVQGIINFEALEVFDNLRIEFPSIIWKHLSDVSWFGFTDQINEHSVEAILFGWFEIRQTSGKKVKKVVHNQPKRPEENRDDDDEEDYDVDELLAQRDLEDIWAEADSRAPANMGQHIRYISGFSLRDVSNELKKIDASIAQLRQEKESAKKNHDMHRLERDKQLASCRRDLLNEIFRLYREDRLVLPNVKPLLEQLQTEAGGFRIPNLQRLEIAKKWALFFEVVERARVLCAERVHTIEENLKAEQQNLHQIRRFGEGHILKGSKVVGMTTTGAAKYNDLVKMMESKIVIVEEAAEVLESHIVTCITKHCQHLILIGDHRQLRPNTTVYDLAKKFHLDISLFERMINNQLNCYQLKVQHRMRPEIANLVVGTVYKELENHLSVLRYPKVMGVTESLYFFCHTELEKSDSDSMSKSNEFEANFLSSLCRYLLLQGYQPHQITVLTTYTGQMFLLKKTFRNLPNCKDVKITCVDNFQGEENDIILLSLVRSNVDSKIGFLNVDNRVCVALSRAKHGLYIVGNMNMLSQKSRIWSQIQDKLTLKAQIGSSMFLECQIHGTVSEIQKEEDFRVKVPEGGCNKTCDTVLPCTHNCSKVCHTLDIEHKNYRCQFPCLLQCPNQHDCTAKCFRKPCPPCNIRIPKALQCGHNATVECWRDENTIACTFIVEKVLPCGHREDMACFKDPGDFICKVEVDKEMPCLHRRTVQCCVDAASLTCKIIVAKTLPCGHQQDAECRFQPDVIKCQTRVNKLFNECGHSREVKCCEKDKPVTCVTPCPDRLACGHACTRLCHVNDNPTHVGYVCRKECARTCPGEGAHKCEKKHKCHTKCPPCTEEVERRLEKCGHIARMPCSNDPLAYECLLKCEKRLECNHTCQNLCFQDCGPCTIPVKKRIRECTHPIEVPCNVFPSRDLCEVMVKPARTAACGHTDAEVPCKISLTVSSENIMLQYCNHPCQTTFEEEIGGCGHACLGTCNSCMQGRFHEKCKSQCGKTLVCGHICEFPCSKSCPPCGKDCMMKCEHSVCKKKCGTPCQDCNETCPWQCLHKRCSKLCREMCDREPCNIPCAQTLSCGHPCIGFCGEPCPPQCRLCNKKELTEFILFGNEEDDDARFVLLPDCGHAIEVEGLEHYMRMSQDEGEIGIKLCPRCRSVIKNCRRFNNAIKTRLNDVVLVKQRVFGNQKKVAVIQAGLIKKLRWESDSLKRYFPTLHDFLFGLVVETVPVSRGGKDERHFPKQVDEYTMDSITAVSKSADEAVKVILKNKLRPELSRDIQNRYRQLFQKVTARQLPYGRLELEDLNRELDRVFDLEQAYLRRSSPQFGDGHAKADPIYDLVLKAILTNTPYTQSRKILVRTLFKQLEDVLKTGLGISGAERQQIIQALGMRQGHWYKCPNGHIYVITECGGANQVGTCNECGAAIGGSNHSLLQGNNMASEMDGAVRPAWPTMLNR